MVDEDCSLEGGGGGEGDLGGLEVERGASIGGSSTTDVYEGVWGDLGALGKARAGGAVVVVGVVAAGAGLESRQRCQLTVHRALIRARGDWQTCRGA